jgi:hypothetical protein
MKIKIPPYPNLRIDETAYKNVTDKAVVANDSRPLSNKLLMLAEYKTGEKRLLHSHSVKHNQNTYFSVFPNPVHLFLSSAIENYEFSEQIKATNFPKCGKKAGENLYALDAEENDTHSCYNSFLRNRCSSIIMLVSSIEAFLNHIIPNDFVYQRITKKGTTNFDKIKIESSAINFKEKLDQVIKQYLESKKYNVNFNEEIKIISDLNRIRNSIIHLKTNAENDISVYFDDIDIMLSFDLENGIQTVINYMNKVKQGFVNTETN